MGEAEPVTPPATRRRGMWGREKKGAPGLDEGVGPGNVGPREERCPRARRGCGAGQLASESGMVRRYVGAAFSHLWASNCFHESALVPR